MKFNLQELLNQYNSKKIEDDFPEDKKRFTDDKRTEARLLAVQTLFTAKSTDKGNIALVNEAIEYSGLKAAHLDKKLFATVAEYALENGQSIDDEITQNLTQDWSLERIDPVASAVLSSAIAELKLQQFSSKLVVSEYLAIASAFLEQDQVKFINAVLGSVISKYNLA